MLTKGLSKKQTREFLTELCDDLFDRVDSLEDALRQIRDLYQIENISLDECLLLSKDIAEKAIGEGHD